MPKQSINCLEIAKKIILAHVPKGGCAIDATAGRGRDTLFLAEHVGASGRVWAFDIQPGALAETSGLLIQHGINEHVQLIQTGHEHMDRYVDTYVHGIMFNLGYLPGGNKNLITRSETTIAALKASLLLLHPGGVVTVVLYPGHEGGLEEAACVTSWTESLAQAEFDVLRLSFPNQSKTAPFLIAIIKR